MAIPHLENTTLAIVLSPDMKKERIIIGERKEIRNHFEGNMKADLILDAKRPIGQFIKDFEPITGFMADMFIEVNSEVYDRRLRELYENGNPIYQYLALRTLQECHLPDYDCYFDFAEDLKYSLFQAILDGQRKWHDNPFIELHPFCSNTKPVELIFDLMTMQEVAIVTYDLLPMAMWYMRKIYDKGYYLQECKICKRTFLAQTATIEVLCGNKCRKENARRNKAEFDERARETGYEKADKNEYAYWYNRLRKFGKGSKEWVVLEKFRSKAKAMKKQVKKGEIPAGEFMDWLYAQRAIVDEIMESNKPPTAKERKQQEKCGKLYADLDGKYAKKYKANPQLLDNWRTYAEALQARYAEGAFDFEDLKYLMQMETWLEDPEFAERRAGM